MSRENNEEGGDELREGVVGNQEEGRVQTGKRGKKLLTIRRAEDLGQKIWKLNLFLHFNRSLLVMMIQVSLRHLFLILVMV